MSSHTVTESQVLEVLKAVIDPDLNQDIVSLGFVKKVDIDGGRVGVTIELTTPACPVKDRFRQQCSELIGGLAGVTEVEVEMTAQVRSSFAGQTQNVLPGVKNTVAVASGKGGVGKSTIAANLACALAAKGSRVGLMDADIYGPSAPIMFGIRERPRVHENKLYPIERHGVQVMSLGLIADEGAPVIWRGPLVARMIQQFLSDVEWGELEYLVIDLPPGTGDAQLTLAQSCPLSGAVVVTTPQQVALEDVYRAMRMFTEVKVPVLGIIENMSYFEAPDTGTRYRIFGEGGGKKVAQEFSVPLIAELPIVPAVCEGGDRGIPAIVGHRGSAIGDAYDAMAMGVASRLSTLALTGAKPVEIKFSRG